MKETIEKKKSASIPTNISPFLFFQDFIAYAEGPNAAFGSGKKSDQPNAKCFPNAIVGLIISLLLFSLLRSCKIKLAKYCIN